MAVERAAGGTSLIDVLDRVLDKGIVIDAWVRVSLVGIDLITVEARVVVASIDTYLKYSEAVGQVSPVSRPQAELTRRTRTSSRRTRRCAPSLRPPRRSREPRATARSAGRRGDAAKGNACTDPSRAGRADRRGRSGSADSPLPSSCCPVPTFRLRRAARSTGSRRTPTWSRRSSPSREPTARPAAARRRTRRFVAPPSSISSSAAKTKAIRWSRR